VQCSSFLGIEGLHAVAAWSSCDCTVVTAQLQLQRPGGRRHVCMIHVGCISGTCVKQAQEGKKHKREPVDGAPEGGDADGEAEVVVNKNKRYRKDKPWDHEGIEHWKVEVCGRSTAAAYMNVRVRVCVGVRTDASARVHVNAGMEGRVFGGTVNGGVQFCDAVSSVP
jgi:hypothetical protein